MAFGSWLKGIFGKARELITKYAPVVKTVLGYVAPVLGQLGGALGGPVGTILSKIGTAGERVGGFIDRVSAPRPLDLRSEGRSPVLGAGGAGIRNIAPRFK